MSGKGDSRRKPQIDRREEDLRWELIKAEPKRKEEILAILEDLKLEKLYIELVTRDGE